MLLCKLGIHGPLNSHEYWFFDTAKGKAVYQVKCPCGKSWLTVNNKWFDFKLMGPKRKRKRKKVKI